MNYKIIVLVRGIIIYMFLNDMLCMMYFILV